MFVRAVVSSLVVAVTFLSVAAACGGGSDEPTSPPGTVASTSIGPTGGTVQGSGVTLRVPEGAVTQPVTIAVAAAADTTAPGDYVALSPIFEFSPDGLVFAKPVTIEITPTSSDGTPGNIVWSTAAGSFEDLPSTLSGSVMTASVTHFSHGFIGHHRGGGGPGAPTDAASDTAPPTDSSITDASTCHSNGGSCDAGSQCCSGSCNGGTCDLVDAPFCGQLHQNCTVNIPCCTGFVCLQAQCLAGG